MVILDIDMPESCSTCVLMRCGMCIAKNSMKVTNDDCDVVRHPDCPIFMNIDDIDKFVSLIEDYDEDDDEDLEDCT